LMRASNIMTKTYPEPKERIKLWTTKKKSKDIGFRFFMKYFRANIPTT
jgi:hypothetical protein